MYTPDYFSDVIDQAIPVRLAALSVILPIPEGCGQPMKYPRDVEGMPSMKKGMLLLDKRGNPKGTGIVFENYTDGAIQAVRDDGAGMIIINSISEEQAQKLLAFTNATIPDPDIATAQQIEDVLTYAHTALGIDDFFNSERAKIPGFEIQTLHPHNRECGIFLRRSDEERFALLGKGSGTFAGPANTPQCFNGTVVVVSNNKYSWMVQTDSFLKTYRHPDDHPIEKGDLPAFSMSPIDASGASPKPLRILSA